MFHPEFVCSGEEHFGKWTFEEKIRKIIANNKVNSSSLQGINKFSHLTFEQFAAKYLGEEEDSEIMVDVKQDGM